MLTTRKIRGKQARVPAGDIVTGDPIFGVEIDWSEQPQGTIDEATAAELAKRLPASLVQAASDYLTGDAPTTLEVWRLQRKGSRSQRSAGKSIDWSIVPLGQMPDAAIAAELEVHQATVQEQRVKRGIPTFRPDRPDPAQVAREARAARRVAIQRQPVLTCPESTCGAQWMSLRLGHVTPYCSDACYWRAENQRKTARRTEYKRQRRAEARAGGRPYDRARARSAP